MWKYLFGLLLLLPSLSLAAVTQNKAVFAQAPNLGVVQFLQGTDVAGTYKTVYTGNANGSKIVALMATSNDTSSNHLVTCEVVTGGVKYGGATVTVAINAGFTNTNPPSNLFSSGNWGAGLPLDSDGNPFIYLPSASYTLQCTFATALTAGKLINVQAVVADF